MFRRRLTEVQKTVLENMAEHNSLGVRVFGPRGTLERLQQKGLVEGDRKKGWVVSRYGRRWLANK